MKTTLTTYNVIQASRYNPATRDFRDVFEIHAANYDAIGCVNVDVLATYSDVESARRVRDALTAHASDLA